jgi:asparaginyl-tRNA synthetase
MRQDYKLVTVRGLFDSKESYADKTVTVGGWIRNNRDSKAIGFIALADGSCFQNLQLVYSKDLENFAEIAKMNVGTAIIATGKIVLTPNDKRPLEMQL